jgi:hypothetical protein
METMNLNSRVSVTLDGGLVKISYCGDRRVVTFEYVKKLIDLFQRAKTDSFRRFLRKHKITTDFKREWNRSSWGVDYKDVDDFIDNGHYTDMVCDAFNWRQTKAGAPFWNDIDDAWGLYFDGGASVSEAIPVLEPVKFRGEYVHVGCQAIHIDKIEELWKLIQKYNEDNK